MTQHDPFDEPPINNGGAPAATMPMPQKPDLGNVDDALSGGTPGAKFENVGDMVKGVILSAEMAQQRDFMTGKPAFWEDGNPKTQILIMLETDQRSADIEDDNGHRMLYVKKPGGMLKAIATALGKTKLSQAIGGTLAVKYTGNGTPPAKGMSPPKIYAARFTPPGGAAQPATNGAEQPALDPKQAAWQQFGKLCAGQSREQLVAGFKKAAEGYSGKLAASLTPDDWKVIGQKIARYGPYVEEMAPPLDSDNTPPLANDDIPF